MEANLPEQFGTICNTDLQNVGKSLEYDLCCDCIQCNISKSIKVVFSFFFDGSRRFPNISSWNIHLETVGQGHADQLSK